MRLAPRAQPTVSAVRRGDVPARTAAAGALLRLERTSSWRCSTPAMLPDMRSDGEPLPDLAETVVLRRLGLVRSDELPNLAARWLASAVVDTESVRMLAGEDPHDPWTLERLLAEAVSEANVVVPSGNAEAQRIAVDWVTATWRGSGDTRWAVRTLAQLGETDPEFDLGLFVGLDDEWNGGWGRLEPDLRADAMRELDRLTHGDDAERRRTL